MYCLISLGLLIVGCFKSSSVMLITSALFAIADALDAPSILKKQSIDIYKE